MLGRGGRCSPWDKHSTRLAWEPETSKSELRPSTLVLCAREKFLTVSRRYHALPITIFESPNEEHDGPSSSTRGVELLACYSCVNSVGL